MNRSNHISHHGVPGMKWGKRKAKQVSDFVSKKVGEIKTKDATNRTRMLELAKSRDSSGTSDRGRFYNASKPINHRVFSALRSEVRSALIGQAIQIAITRRPPTPKMIDAAGRMVLQKTAKKVITDSILARSASKKYDSHGNLLPRFKNQRKNFLKLTREDKMDAGYKIASASFRALSPFMKVALAKKVKKWSQEKQAIREARESVFTKAVLERRVPVWNSEDGSVSVFDP